ncbi:hypothetical protein LJ737_13960 [Hymenobacter sp. 15J16-1T3B]|uniref:hypothetical protein n=1 Tax=Hymenobacter sp. 15J16-1T3B TaxID=2886941 RepID=UPI001D1193E3|nr:hypothetical protein [Hymenobacter sp. 15J16-1T3B]MCC3158349.1 hypothetical protein [Hymenobacter sp. 15J16-1T3B]
MIAAPLYPRRPRRTFCLPDRSALAATLLAISTAWLACADIYYSDISQPPHVHLPVLNSGVSRCMPDKGSIVISMDAAGRSYFSADSRSIQTATIQQLANRHNVHFSAAQQRELAQLPYLGMDVRQLPAYLSLPSYARPQQALSGLPYNYSNDQLTACVITGRQSNIRLLNSAPYIVLNADSRTQMADIKRFMRTLQRQHLYRFYVRHLAFSR